MIKGHTLDSSNKFTAKESTEGEASLKVASPTFAKEQLMVYVKFDRQTDGAIAKLKMQMSDPSIDNGTPFQMCSLDGTTVVPVEIVLVASGFYRVPVPVGSNETKIFVDSSIVGGDAETDSLEFWVALNSYQPVSGMIQ
jgi:hypothetical protein